MMRGTLINVATVLVGTGLGLLLGGRLPERLRRTVMDVLGLFTVVLGLSNALDAFGEELAAAVGRAAVLIVLGSLLLGAVVGELLDLEAALERLGDRLRRAVRRGAADAPDQGGGRFVEGFVVASLVFCVGPLTVLGSLQDGLTGDFQLLAIKSLLDGFASLAFASALGIGVGFSALSVLVVQGGIALAAGALEGVITDPMIAAMTAAGGVLVMAIGLRLLDIRQVRVANLLPALLLAPLAVALWPA
jgi:uncharacterized membrane protein YqgA involved in biofilm formation